MPQQLSEVEGWRCPPALTASSSWSEDAGSVWSIAKLMVVSNPIAFNMGQTCPCLQDSPVPTGVLRNRNGRSGPGSQGRLSQEQSWAAPSPHLDILDAKDGSEHSWEFACSIRAALAQLCFWCSQGAMPSGLWTRVRSRKREEGCDKEGQVVSSNAVLMHSPRSGFSGAPSSVQLTGFDRICEYQ